jgi:hypothetical protein
MIYLKNSRLKPSREQLTPHASRNTHLSSYGRMDAIYDPNPDETVRAKIKIELIQQAFECSILVSNLNWKRRDFIIRFSITVKRW